MTDRIPGAPGQFKAVISPDQLAALQNGEEFTIKLTRDDQPEVEGTPYSKAAVLPDELAEKLCPGYEDPTPANAFSALLRMIPNVATVMISAGGTDRSITPLLNQWYNIPEKSFFLAQYESQDGAFPCNAFGWKETGSHDSDATGLFLFINYLSGEILVVITANGTSTIKTISPGS